MPFRITYSDRETRAKSPLYPVLHILNPIFGDVPLLLFSFCLLILSPSTATSCPSYHNLCKVYTKADLASPGFSHWLSPVVEL